MNQEAYQQLSDCILFLAGRCDGAVAQDGAGFNGVDTHFGHSLAEQMVTGRTLTTKQVQAAAKMVQKYRNQCAGAGLEMPKPSAFAEQKQEVKKAEQPAVTITTNENGQLVVAFAYNKALVDKIKSLPSAKRHFDWQEKNWLVHPSLKKEVLAMFGNAKATESVRKAKATTTINIGLEDGAIVVGFAYDPELVRKVKSLAERKFRPADKKWLVPARLANEVLAMFPEASIAPAVLELVKQQQELASMSDQATSHFEIDGILGEPMPFQRAGVHFIEKANGRAIVADEMGLGKTLQALAWLQLHPEKRPCVIVVPASLKINWQREITKWMTTPDRVIILSGTKADQLPVADIYIINYDILSAWRERLVKDVKPQVVIADEAHYLKHGKKTQRGKAFIGHKDETGLIEVAEHVILLTGTPVTNRPLELFPLLNIIAPEAWGNFFQYAKRYTSAYHNGHGWSFNGASNLEELHQITRPYIVRRTKKQVLTELPEKRRANVVLEMTAGGRIEYEKRMQEAVEAMAGGALGFEHLSFIEKAKQAAVAGKMKAAIKWIDTFLSTDSKLVVFCTHKFVVNELMKKFGNKAVKVTGDVTGKARQAAVDAFQNDDNVRLFVGNITAAGVGLTLTAASDVAFLELGWTPGEHDQAEDRCHRIGQDADSVTAWYLLSENTIDEDIAELLEKKRQVVDVVTDGKASGLKFGLLRELGERISVYNFG